MKALFTSMLQALAQGEGVVLCSILASSGSTPRGAGAKMAVFADGHTEGTVGGGAVELESGKLAMEVLKTKQSLVHGYCLAPNEVADIGMICGGNVTVFFQYFDPQAEADTALLRGILELLNGNQNSWLVYRMDDGCVSAMGTYDEAHGLRFTDCITPDELRPMLRADAVTKKGEPRYYVEPLTRAGYAYIFGGGHVGAALVPVLASVDFRVVVYDNRPGFATPEHYPQAERVILGDYLDIGAHLTLTENDYVCIMTPGHQADREVLLQAMRSPATYIGCIGSRHKIASTNAYLMENGIPEAELARIHAPIGLDILGQTPAEIAVSLLMTISDALENSSFRLESSRARMESRVCASMNRPGIHLVPLGCSSVMVKISRAAGDGPLKIRFADRHAATRIRAITVNSTRKNRRTIRPNRPLPFFFFFLGGLEAPPRWEGTGS